jgi:tetratricopeptide (TPR) repeat protein
LSLLSKAMAVSFPVVMILVDYLRGRPVDKQSLVEKIPFFILSIVFGVIAVLFQAGIQQTGMGEVALSAFERLFVAGYGVLFFVVKFIVPINLSILHDLPITETGSLAWYAYGSALVAAAGIASLIFARRKVPMVVFGGLFFLVTFAPVSQILPVGVPTIAERFTYIPLFGLSLLVASGFLLIRDHFLKPRGFSESASAVVVVAWIMFLASQTIGQTKVWKDDITLWTSVIDKPPPPALAYLQRGLAHAAAFRPREAAEDYTRAIQRDSSLAPAWNNRGLVFVGVGNYDQAVTDYKRAVALAPSYTDAYLNLGRALMLQKDFAGAIENYGKAIELDTTNAQGHYYRGQAYFNQGDLDSALIDYDRALQLNPALTEAYVRRGDIYFQTQRFEEAIADYTEGINRGASHEFLFTNRGSSFANLGDFDRAIEDFNKALEINPSYVDALLNRGIAFIAKKDYKLALVHFNMLENMGHPQDPKIMKFLKEQAALQERTEK